VHVTTAVAFGLALVSTTLIIFSYLREHGAVAELPPLSIGHPLRSLRLLLTNRAWLGGFAMETTGFALYVAALALAPLALVQSVAAGGIGVLAFASARLARRRLTPREAAGAAISVAGLLFLALSLIGGAEQSRPGSTFEILLWLGGTAVAAVLVFSVGRRFLGMPVAAGIAGGLLFSGGDIATKVTTQGGTRLLFALPLIVGYVLGTSLLQIGYQSGAALTIAGIATLLTNALPIAAGPVLLSEPVPSGALGVLRILAFAAVIAGAILLARPTPVAAKSPETDRGAHALQTADGPGRPPRRASREAPPAGG
jgi:drug/metabolite transporter (DMT)-like permease